MKQSLLSIICGLLCLILFQILYGLFPPIKNEVFISVSTSLTLFVGGFVAGVIAKTKSWLHGAIVGGFIYFIGIIFTLTASLILVFMRATWTGGNLFNYELTLVKYCIMGSIIGAFGAIIGNFISDKFHTIHN